MEVLLFFFKYKTKAFFKDWKSKGERNLFFLFIFIFYAVFIALTINKALEDGNFSPDKVSMIASLIFVIFVFLSDFFPVYISTKDLISRIYPISYIKRTIIDLINDFGSTFILLVFVVVTVFPSVLNMQIAYKIDLILCMALGVINAHLYSKMIRLMIDKRIVNQIIRFTIFLVLFVFITIYCFLFTRFFSSIFFNLAFVIHSLFMVTIITRFSVDRKVYHLGTKIPYQIQLFTGNNQFQVSFFIMIIVKTVVIVFFKWIYHKTNDQALLIPVVLFSSPLLVFTYLFNYFSGYFRSIYLNFRLANINPSGQIKFLIKNIAPYIFLDLVLTFILTWSTYSSVFWLFYYMSLIVILTTISFFTNVLKYFKEKRMMGNLISFGLSLFFSLVYIFEKGEIIFIGLSYILLSGLLIILYYVFYYQMFCKSLDKASH